MPDAAAVIEAAERIIRSDMDDLHRMCPYLKTFPNYRYVVDEGMKQDALRRARAVLNA